MGEKKGLGRRSWSRGRLRVQDTGMGVLARSRQEWSYVLSALAKGR